MQIRDISAKWGRFSIVGLLLMFMAVSGQQAMAAEINDAAALKDLKQAKGVFLIDFTNAKKTAFYLELLRGTHASLVKQGVEPDLILVFIGQTVKYLSSKPSDELQLEFGKELSSIADSVQALGKLGVRMEVCALATDVFGIDNRDILPAMDVVGDGFISLIGWQNQDYKLVPIF